MGFQFEQINSISIELKKENDILKKQLKDINSKKEDKEKPNKNNS